MSKGKKKRRPPEASEDQGRPLGASEETGEPAAPKRDWRKWFSIPKPKTKGGGLVELAVIVALAIGLALAIQAWIVKPYVVPSESMEPTLDVGQRILANRFIYHFEDLEVGDIIVFHPPAGANDHGTGCGVLHSSQGACPEPTPERSDQNFVKRLVAEPGDRVRIIHGLAIVNGKVDPAANDAAENDLTLNECGEPLPPSKWKSVRSDGHCNFTKPITVPNGHYFMMGDRRGGSLDSRYWGPVPRDWIIGKVFATYWPPDRWGFF